MTTSPQDPEGVDAVCHFCGRNFTAEGLDPDDHYCYGCGEYVCEECDHRDPGSMGSHDVSDHEEGEWEDEEEDCP
jgi:hypothetical protein